MDKNEARTAAGTFLKQRMGLFTQALWFLLVVMAAVFSISELAARDTTMNLIGGRVAALRAEYVERSGARLGMVPAAYYYRASAGLPLPARAAASSPSSEATVEELLKQDQVLLKQIQFIEDVRRDLQGLAAVGGSSAAQSLRAILARYQASASTIARGTTEPPKTSMLGQLYEPLILLSSDQLLAISIMACGAIGALIAMLRSSDGMSVNVLVLGVAAGFVTYLAIKGGKHVFLLQSQGELATFNPYGSAFAGLLAGLFTEKAHQVLTGLVDEFIERLKFSARPHADGNQKVGKKD